MSAPRSRPASPLLLLVMLTILGSSAFGQAAEKLASGDQAPDWILTSAAGEVLSFYEDSAGLPAVLLFWTSWSPDGQALMTALQTLREHVSAGRIRFYALNIWEEAEPEQLEGFTLLLNAERVARRYKVRAAPTLFVVDGDKTIRYSGQSGEQPEQVVEAIRSVLEGRPQTD